MKPIIYIPGIVVSLSLIFSCKKDSGDDGSNGTILSKVVVLTADPYASIAVNRYHYDAQNRVTEIAYSNGEAAKGESGAKYVSSTKWFYKGDEQLPYKSAEVSDSAVSSELYYFYDNQGRLATDSFLPSGTNSYTIKKYTWYFDRVLTVSATHVMGTIAMSTDSIQINSHNLLAQFGTSYPLGQGMPAFYFTYDKNINPLHTLNIHAAIPLITMGGISNYGYSENNYTEMKTGFFKLFGGPAGTFSQAGTLTCKYNYNAHHLPVDCEATGDGNIIGSTKTKFYYTN